MPGGAFLFTARSQVPTGQLEPGPASLLDQGTFSQSRDMSPRPHSPRADSQPARTQPAPDSEQEAALHTTHLLGFSLTPGSLPEAGGAEASSSMSLRVTLFLNSSSASWRVILFSKPTRSNIERSVS